LNEEIETDLESVKKKVEEKSLIIKQEFSECVNKKDWNRAKEKVILLSYYEKLWKRILEKM